MVGVGQRLESIIAKVFSNLIDFIFCLLADQLLPHLTFILSGFIHYTSQWKQHTVLDWLSVLKVFSAKTVNGKLGVFPFFLNGK